MTAACSAAQPTLAPPRAEASTTSLHVYADFRCPHCARFSASYTPRILRNFKAELSNGSFTFEHRNLPVLGPESEYLALHAECAREQHRFQQFHDALYLTQYRAATDSRIMPVDGPGPLLTHINTTAGIDEITLATCLDTERPYHTVEAHIADATRLGINATPTLVLNGALLTWDSYDSIIHQIDLALTRAPP